MRKMRRGSTNYKNEGHRRRRKEKDHNLFFWMSRRRNKGDNVPYKLARLGLLFSTPFLNIHTTYCTLGLHPEDGANTGSDTSV
jgi:hypothetical protein